MPKNVYLVYVTLATGDICAPFIFLGQLPATKVTGL